MKYEEENEKKNFKIYDLTELYESQAELRGQIRAGYYILNNC